MKFSIKGYWKPTPKNVRKIADSILASATLVSAYSFINEYKSFALYVMIVSATAKFISNFFSDDKSE